MTKSVIIYYTLDDYLKFRIADGDHSHLNNKYINSNATDEECDEINALTLYPKGHELEWHDLDDFSESFPRDVLNSDETIVIVVVGIV